MFRHESFFPSGRQKPICFALSSFTGRIGISYADKISIGSSTLPRFVYRDQLRAGQFSLGSPFLATSTKMVARVPDRNGNSRSSALVKPGETVIRRTGMNSAMVLSKELQEMLGKEMMTRCDIAAGICAYIRQNNLYVKGDHRKFTCDETLSRALNTEGEHLILHVSKLLRPLLTHPSAYGQDYEQKAEELFRQHLKERGAIDITELKRRDSRGRGAGKTQQKYQERGQGMFSDVEIAPCLRPICNGKERMSRPQVVKAVWDYIKKNGLQDASNRRRILINDDLREALQVGDLDTLDSFQLSRYIVKLYKNPSRVKKS